MAPKPPPKKAPASPVEQPSTEVLQAQVDASVLQRNEQAKERNRMQLDRDKLNTILEIRKMECEEAEAGMRNKAREIEELEEMHHGALKVFNQKMKHLIYDQEVNLKQLKLDNEKLLSEQREHAVNRENELMNEMRVVKEQLKEVEHNYDDVVKHLKLDQSKEIAAMKREFDAGLRDLTRKIEKQVKDVREDNELRRRQEVREIEERKNTHIRELARRHDEAYQETNSYYNQLMHNSLDLIKTLKDDINEMRMNERTNERVMLEISEANRTLSDPLMKAMKQVELLRKQLAMHEKDRRSLEFLRCLSADTAKQTRNLEWKFELLKSDVQKLQAEKDAIRSKFESCILDTQAKCEVKSNLLQKQAQFLIDQLENKEAQLRMAISKAISSKAMAPASVESLQYGIDRILETKNQQIKALHFEKGRVCQSYCHVLRAFKTTLNQMGVSTEEVGLAHYVIPGVA